MDIETLALAKKFALNVAAGFSKVETSEGKIKFTLNDGKTAEIEITKPITVEESDSEYIIKI